MHDIITATEQAEQTERREHLAEYRRLLTEGTADDAPKLRDLAQRLGRAERLREDHHIARRVAQADDLKAEGERLAKRMEAATRDFKAKDEAVERAQKQLEQAEDARWEANRLFDRTNREQKELREREQECERLRAENPDLFGDPTPEAEDHDEMVELDGMLVRRSFLPAMEQR